MAIYPYYYTQPAAPPGWSVWGFVGGFLLNAIVGGLVVLGVLLWRMHTSLKPKKGEAKQSVGGELGAIAFGLADFVIGGYTVVPVAFVVTGVCAFQNVSLGHTILWNALASAVAAVAVFLTVRP